MVNCYACRTALPIPARVKGHGALQNQWAQTCCYANMLDKSREEAKHSALLWKAQGGIIG